MKNLTKAFLFYTSSSLSSCFCLMSSSRSVGLVCWVLVTSSFLGRSGSSNMRLEGLAISFSLIHIGGVHGKVVSGELLLSGNGSESSRERVGLSFVRVIWGSHS